MQRLMKSKKAKTPKKSKEKVIIPEIVQDAIERKKPRKKAVFTEEQRKQAQRMAAVGVTAETIARYFDCDIEALYREAGEAMKRGRAETEAAIAGTLVRDALAGNTTAQLFWLKTKGGWRETTHLEIDTKNNVINFNVLSPEEFEKKHLAGLLDDGSAKDTVVTATEAKDSD